MWGKDLWPIIASGGIVLLGFLLRLLHLGAQELWFDEIVSFQRATWGNGLFDVLRLEDSPPLYFLLLRSWLLISGIDEAAVRLPSAVVGTLCVMATIWAGRQIFSTAAGLWAGAFVAVAPIHVYYSQEARTYALVTFELAVTYGLVWRAMRVNAKISWAMAAFAAVAALYSHYYAALGLLPVFLILWVWPHDEQSALRRKRIVVAGLVCMSLLAPWLLLTFFPYPHVITILTNGWIAALWESTPAISVIPRTLEVFTLGPQQEMVVFPLKQFVALSLPDTLRWLGLGHLLGLVLWVAVPWQDGALNIPEVRRRKLWVTSLLITPLVILWLVSFYRPVYVIGRYDMVGFVAFALLIGLAFAKLQNVRRIGPILTVLAGLGLFVPICAKLLLYYQGPAPHYARETSQAIHRMVENGDVVMLNQIRGLPILAYYLPREGYEWNNDTCHSTVHMRKFGCRLFLPEDELKTAKSPEFTPEMARTFVEGSLSQIKGTDANAWAVLGYIQSVNGTLVDWGLDRLVTGELRKAGLDGYPLSIDGVPILYLFRPAH